MTNLTSEKKKAKEWDKLDVPIQHEGRAITLPADPVNMPLTKAVEALRRKIADEEQIFCVHEVIEAYPHDAAVAFTKAMVELYGWGSPQTEHHWYGDKPPTMLAVKTGFRDDDVVQCPLGVFKLPGIDEDVKTSFYPMQINDKKTTRFIIKAQVKKRDRHLVLELANETRRIVREESIYRGKPIRLGVTDNGELDIETPPVFLDVTDISESDVMFDGNIMRQIETSILVPIRHTEECRRHKIPLKRGILLEGGYGTGKTLTARLTAREGELHGWTFVLLDKVQGLRAALEFAKQYAPAIVFAEDVDRVASQRNDATNDLINTIDGVVSKNTDVMVVLTTNFVDNLDPVILRPGRLDAVISLKTPNAETVQRLVRYYAGNLVAASENLTPVGTELAGQIPASIRETVERAKLSMIGRRATTLLADDLVVAAQTMKNHLALLNKKMAEVSVGDKLADALRAAVMNGGEEKLAEVHKKLAEVHKKVIGIHACGSNVIS